MFACKYGSQRAVVEVEWASHMQSQGEHLKTYQLRELHLVLSGLASFQC